MSGDLREPQQDRGRATRARLLEAAFEALSEIGWSATSVAEVAERAGVSRGAAQHYFPTSAGLIYAAVEHMTEVGLAEVEHAAGQPEDLGVDRAEGVVEMLADLYTGPLFRAAIQVWAAAATNPALSARVLALEAGLARAALQVRDDRVGRRGVGPVRPRGRAGDPRPGAWPWPGRRPARRLQTPADDRASVLPDAKRRPSRIEGGTSWPRSSGRNAGWGQGLKVPARDRASLLSCGADSCFGVLATAANG